MIVVEKETQSPVRVFLVSGDKMISIGTISPLFWDRSGCDDVRLAINYHKQDHSSVVFTKKNVDEYFKAVETLHSQYEEVCNLLIGRGRKALDKWVDETEYRVEIP